MRLLAPGGGRHPAHGARHCQLPHACKGFLGLCGVRGRQPSLHCPPSCCQCETTPPAPCLPACPPVQYAATRPLFDMLLQAYPQFLQPAWFDYDSYLWAAELWYSYAFEIEFPEAPADGEGATQAAAAGSALAAGAAGCGEATGQSGGRPAGPKSRSAAGGGSKAAKARRRQGNNGSAGGSSSADTAAKSSSSASSSKPVMVPFAW